MSIPSTILQYDAFFYAEYILPEIFNMEMEENKAFMQSTSFELLIKSMNEGLKDAQYEKFVNLAQKKKF